MSAWAFYRAAEQNKFTPNGVRRNRIMDDFMNTVTEKIVPEAIRLIIVIVLAALCFFLIKRFTKFIARPAHLSKLSPSVKTFLVSFLSIALKTLTVITGASMLGVPMASVVAVIGSAGLAFGLALQGGLSNIAGGFMILIFKPFSVGHYIEVGSFAGTVTDIGVFYTTLLTYDNVRVVIPNSTVTSGTVVNYSSEEKRRVDIDFTAAYSTDVEKAKRAILEAAYSTGKILPEPCAEVVMTEHGESALKLSLRAWCATSDYWTVKFETTEKVKAAFDREGIEIPFPQLDVHLDK